MLPSFPGRPKAIDGLLPRSSSMGRTFQNTHFLLASGLSPVPASPTGFPDAHSTNENKGAGARLVATINPPPGNAEREEHADTPAGCSRLRSGLSNKPCRLTVDAGRIRCQLAVSTQPNQLINRLLSRFSSIAASWFGLKRRWRWTIRTWWSLPSTTTSLAVTAPPVSQQGRFRR